MTLRKLVREALGVLGILLLAGAIIIGNTVKPPGQAPKAQLGSTLDK